MLDRLDIASVGAVQTQYHLSALQERGRERERERERRERERERGRSISVPKRGDIAKPSCRDQEGNEELERGRQKGSTSA